MILMAAVGVVALTDARSPQLPARIPPTDGQSRQAGKAPASHDTPEWSLQGRVLDRRTGRPLPRFRISVGSYTPLGRFEWDEVRGYQDPDGRFVIRLSKTAPSPALRVDADGYLPAGGGVLEQDQASLEFRLEAGVGPRGRIVGQDGEPVREATVALIGPGVEAVHVDVAGRLTASGWKETVRGVAADGGFAFKPQLEPLHLLAWSRTGFRLLSSDELKRQPEVRLLPWGQLQGSVHGPSGPLTNAKLVMVAAGAFLPHVTSLGETVSDAEGRFKFERVPAMPVEVHFADPQEFQMLAEIQVSEGETRSLDLQARPLPRSSTPRPPALPFPKRIEGEKLRGVVLSPAGRPVEKAEVAFVVPGRFLSLGRFRFQDNLREISLLDVTDAQGRFTLPLCEGLESIMAVGREGFLRTSLESVRRSNTVRLEPWATIEGTLPGPGVLDSDRVVRLQRRSTWSFGARLAEQHGLAIPAEESGPGIELSLPDFLVHVDSAGRFTFPFVPAGAYVILDAVPVGSRSSMWRTLAEVRVAAGQTARVAPGAGHRSVRARVRLEGRPPDWTGKEVRAS
ncbi:MAG TPA: carboxypeptidase-like regulatory domain-containing protein, partial [Myxococcota bacterium]|nr:carboxypeptidase-like regulatory domain-containing protein [Myxococcota bacterium]